MKRSLPLAFRHHSRTFPAMSYVPKALMPRMLPTGTVPWPEKLLAGTTQALLKDGRVIPWAEALARMTDRSGPAGPVGHPGQGLRPRDHTAVLHERVVPELPASVPAAIHEALELAVGHLEPIHQIVAQRDRLDVLEAGEKHVQLAAGDSDHLGRERTVPVEADHGIVERGAHEIERSVAWRLDPQAVRIREEDSAPAQRQ